MKSLSDHAVHTVMINQRAMRTVTDLASAERATLPMQLVAYRTSREVLRAA